MKLILVIAVIFLSACASEVIQPADIGPHAPATGKPKQGTVVYNPDGMKDFVDSRRKDALKKIYDICGSNNYKITKEEFVKPKAMVSGGLSTIGASRLNYVHFECL